MEKILIVDDDKANINILVNILKDRYKVMVAKNGIQALSAFNGDGQPDLVLLDVLMPGMDGYEVCRRLKSDPATKDTPVIFVTAMSGANDEAKGFDLGGVDFITKPVSAPVVRARVKTQLELKKQREMLFNLSYFDGLTELANRRFFDTRLNEEWFRSMRDETPVGLLIMDIDCFKSYNDNYGHQSGDICLTRVAGQIMGVPKRAGDLVARYGGEEFACILANTEIDGVKTIGTRILNAVRDLKIKHEFSPTAEGIITISIGGTSIVPYKEIPIEALVEIADRKLYEAKNSGRNQLIIKSVANN